MGVLSSSKSRKALIIDYRRNNELTIVKFQPQIIKT